MTVTIRYDSGGPFHEELKRRADAYFARSGLARRGGPALVLKTVILLGWFALSYGLLVFVASTWWQATAAAVSLGLAMAGIGFGIQHDANHNSYSESPAANRLLGLTLDMLGGSSYLWRWKHNVFHHTHTNVGMADPDLQVGPLLRLSPHQPRLWGHRFQHVYAWLLYAFMPVKWQFMDDFEVLARGRIQGHKFPRPQGWELVAFFGGKLVFYGWAVVVPALVHPLWQVLVFHMVASATLGVTLSVVFQLAHCLEEADFPQADPKDGRLHCDWALNQVHTTVDFSPGNRLLTWYLGGLNYQVVHHLFPRVSHLHYPALARVVEETCQHLGERYRVHGSMGAALASHARWLHRLGHPGELAPMTLTPAAEAGSAAASP